MRLQLSKESFGRLGQPKGGAEVDEDSRRRKGPSKAHQPLAPQVVARAPEENGCDDDVDAHGKDLVGQAAEQDVVGRRGVLAVRLHDADEGRAGDLRNGGNDVGDDEEPENGSGRQHRVAAAALHPVDEHREDGVDAGGEEDGRGDDEEVVEDKVDEVVGVLFRREGARAVPDNLKEQTDGKGDEPPGAEAHGLSRMHDEVEEKVDGGKDGEGKGGREAVDDDGDVVRAVGVGKVGVDVAGAADGCKGVC